MLSVRLHIRREVQRVQVHNMLVVGYRQAEELHMVCYHKY
jgi:hypothetical protein